MKTKKNVCILSMQRIDNMGSLLQAYGLRKFLTQFGCNVEFKDIRRIDDDYALVSDYFQNFGNEFEKTGFIGKLSKIDRYFFNRLKTRTLEKQQHNKFERFRYSELKLQHKKEKYDLCVIGSDEVFNCINTGYWGFTSQLFGNVPEVKSVITYAASCGSTTIDDIPNTVKNRIQETFSKIDAFSVRDKNTYNFVRSLTSKSIEYNLDPVLVSDYRTEMESVEMPKVPQRYCIVYSYRNRIHDRKEIKEIKKFCKKHMLVPIAVGAPQAWISNYVVCSPFQCLKLFEKSEYVITDTFHGTIFSVKYAKRFGILLRKSNNNKLGDLVERLDISDHVMDNITDLEETYYINKSEQVVNRILSEERVKTCDYLEGHIV